MNLDSNVVAGFYEIKYKQGSKHSQLCQSIQIWFELTSLIFILKLTFFFLTKSVFVTYDNNTKRLCEKRRVFPLHSIKCTMSLCLPLLDYMNNLLQFHSIRAMLLSTSLQKNHFYVTVCSLGYLVWLLKVVL